MVFFKRTRKKEIDYEYKQEDKVQISSSIDENIKIFKDTFKDANDLIFRDMCIGERIRGFICQIDGLSDKNLVDDYVIEPLMEKKFEGSIHPEAIGENIYKYIQNNRIAANDISEAEYIEDALKSLLSGETILFLDGYNKAVVIATRMWPARGPSEPIGESVLRGSRDGLVETIRFNTALVRRRIRDPRLKVKQSQVGERSKTDIALMYIDDIVNKDVLKQIEDKLSKINIDSILDSGYIQQFLETNTWTPFPQIQATERPDVVASAIYEGKIVILVDNSPSAIILPITLTAFFQSAEDYYIKPIVATAIRILRIIAIFIAILSPALYIALTVYNPEIIPTKLAMSITASREGVPFPAFIEILIMEITLELLREAGVRLPKPIGSTIGIVGGLVIGQAAVSAGIVSPIAVIIIAITAIATFTAPNYEIEGAFRIVRIGMMLCAAVYGLYGIVLGTILLLIHLIQIESYGAPYFEPLAPMRIRDLKDSLFIRAPWRKMKYRPEFLRVQDKIRQAGDDSDSN